MFELPTNSRVMFKEIEDWISPQNKQMQSALLLSIYKVYVDAKIEIALAQLMDEE